MQGSKLEKKRPNRCISDSSELREIEEKHRGVKFSKLVRRTIGRYLAMTEGYPGIFSKKQRKRIVGIVDPKELETSSFIAGAELLISLARSAGIPGGGKIIKENAYSARDIFVELDLIEKAYFDTKG
jgi:hypothetical protein